MISRPAGEGRRPFLTAGRRPVVLPPRLAAVLGELAAQPPPRLMIASGPEAPCWLFASDLPAAVLADFPGIHVNTPVRWVTYARQDWAAYLAARDADHRSFPGRPKGTR